MSAISNKHYTAPRGLDRPLDLSRLNLEVLAWVGLVLLSIITHLWALDRMALHHDESIHAWMSWKFLTGQGGDFTCSNGTKSRIYCYDPVYHGPSLYFTTLVSYFLFGDGNTPARLPEAIAGILMVGSAWMLRPYLGRRGAFLAGVLLAVSPTMLYFTRFARHDALIALFTLWMVIGFFRYLDTGRAGYLYLLFISAALAVATHELYYILFFLFGAFVVIRLLWEFGQRRALAIALLVIALLCIPIEIWNPRLSATLQAAGMAYLFMAVTLSGLLMLRVWDDRPLLIERARTLWFEQRGDLWRALIVAGVIYLLLYTTFFTYVRGALAPYDGLRYWLGKQQEFKRGDQPWYYYLMQLTIYEPLAFYGSIMATIYLLSRPGRRLLHLLRGTPASDHVAPATVPAVAEEDAERATGEGLPEAPAPPSAVNLPPIPLLPLFLTFWFVGALISFSWAGEKMPWLTIHITLPASLLIAWGLGRLLDSFASVPGEDPSQASGSDLEDVTPSAAKGLKLQDDAHPRIRYYPSETSRSALLLIPPMVLLLVVMLGVALWRLAPTAEGQQGQASLLQGLIPLGIVGLLIYGILTVGQRIGRRATLALCGLTVAGLLLVYGLRSTWLVVYDHPDTPREFLVFVQSAPDVPLIVREIRELAIAQTRNSRSPGDPVGGLTMPVIMSTGDANGEGSLSWPYIWYFRDFQRIEGRNDTFFREATADSFLVDTPQRNGEKELAPVVMVYKPQLYESGRQALEANYVKRYESKLNWWFPEGNKCAPDQPGYKRFYYSASAPAQIRSECGLAADADVANFGNVLSPLGWVFDRANWNTIGRYLLYREIPAPLQLDGREMEVWVRRDLAGGAGGDSSAAAADAPVKLVAQQVINGSGQGQLSQPRGIASDANGRTYTSDLNCHCIQVFAPDGSFERTIGELGSGDGQFNEPRGLAVDGQGNLYVADTWNARVVKLDSSGKFLKAWGEGDQDFGGGRRASMTDGTEAGNAAKPLGFFGPRGIAVDSRGNVYIADTGNKRIVVTDSEGNYLYQWGRAGGDPGAFNEPIGVAVDAQGNVYVADSWNGRVQMFAREENGQVNPLPAAVWRVAGWQPNTYDDPFIAVGKDGQVFVTIPGRNQAAYYNQQGDVLLRWGGRGSDFASLNLPSGITVAASGRVMIVDRGNVRVVAFDLPQVAAPQPEEPPAR